MAKSSQDIMAEPRKDPPKDSLVDGMDDFDTKDGAAFAKSSGVGAKISHADAPDDLWTVIGSSLVGGDVELVVAKGAEKRKLAMADFAFWRTAEPTVEQAVAAYEAAVKPAYAKKLAEARADVEAKVDDAKVSVLADLRRALDIVAKRFDAGLEEMPLRVGLEAALSEPRVLGHDATTGERVDYPGMSPHLASVLTAEALGLCHQDHIDAMLMRAAELLSKSSEYLSDAEAEAAHLRVAMPQVSLAMIASAVSDDDVLNDPRVLDAIKAAAKRNAARRGNNLPVVPETDAGGDFSEGADVLRMRAAVQGTRVSRLAARMSGE